MRDLDDVIPLINEDGAGFTTRQIKACFRGLAALDATDRMSARDRNSDAIATHDSSRMLVLSGPGTGKSTLFKRRISHWLSAYPTHHIAVATFVHKLVDDLNSDIATDSTLSDGEKSRVDVRTLHGMARGIVERSGGTPEVPLARHCLVISTREWEEMLWEDTIALQGDVDAAEFLWGELLHDLYDANPPATGDWGVLRAQHVELQRFYSALTFPDLILFATRAIEARPELIGDTLFIIDEFQDFNVSEERLIRALVSRSPAVLLAGDDDQVLYDTLRRALPEIIRSYYQDPDFVKAMLPLCSRCGFHICRAAEAFLASESPDDSIQKVFLPLDVDPTADRVNVVASTSPKIGVAYIEQFLTGHDAAIRQRHEDLQAGRKEDAYLLILTPARNLNFLNVDGARDRLREILRDHSPDDLEISFDYWKARDYYHGRARQNFSLRKVLSHEQVDRDTVTAVLRQAMDTGTSLADVDHEAIRSCLDKCDAVQRIITGDEDSLTQAAAIVALGVASDTVALARDLERLPLRADKGQDGDVTYPEQAAAVGAISLTTIVGAKGLSADHVIVLGCDDVNLRVSHCAFFVALTRARKSLTLLACIGGGGASRLHPFVLSLPDTHTNALYAKSDRVHSVGSIAVLQGQLEKWAYAKSARIRKK